MKDYTAKPFLIIADDLGQHPAINRGIIKAISNQALTGCDVLLNEPYSIDIVKLIQSEFPDISIGLHINSFPDSPTLISSPMVYELRGLPYPKEELIVPLLRQTVMQIREFGDLFGKNPLHISTHDHAHTNRDGQIFESFIECVEKEIGSIDSVVIRGFHTIPVRHARNINLKRGIPPLAPRRFQQMIIDMPPHDIALELLAHPALAKKSNEGDLYSDYSLDLRMIDLEGLLHITNSGIIQKTGYKLITPEDYIKELRGFKRLDFLSIRPNLLADTGFAE